MATAVEQERLVEVEADESVGGGRRVVGEEKTFRGYDPDQVLLMAPVLAEWVPEGDLAHFVSDLVESGTPDLGAIYDAYEEERVSLRARCLSLCFLALVDDALGFVRRALDGAIG